MPTPGYYSEPATGNPRSGERSYRQPAFWRTQLRHPRSGERSYVTRVLANAATKRDSS